ncbi:unnamed protein product, partial [Meganyctiphanes norvegica]
RNFGHIVYQCSNVTKEEICLNVESDCFNEILRWLSIRKVAWGSLWIVLLTHVALEINNSIRKKRLLGREFEMHFRRLQIILVLAIIIPYSNCSVQLMIITEPSWIAGIAAMVLAWVILINTMNKMPVLSVFMPLSRMFLTSFAKIIFYFAIIISVFALVFNLLIYNNEAFVTWPQAFIKTITWMLGDLSYNDTFIEETPHYQVFANIFFVIFIFTMAIFISNLVVTLPSNSFEDFSKKAEFHKLANCVKLFLTLDVCFPFLRRWYPLYQYIETQEDNKRYGSRLLLVDTIHKTSEVENTQDELEDLKGKICILTEAVNKLVEHQTQLLNSS